MTATTHLNETAQRKTILPEDSLSAIKIMTSITRQMLELLIEEGKLLKKRDLLTFNAMQKGKELLADGYARACKEFQNRMDEFKGLDSVELDKLDAMTRELGKTAKANHKQIESLSTKKPINTNGQNNLFLLQSEDTQSAAAQS